VELSMNGKSLKGILQKELNDVVKTTGGISTAPNEYLKVLQRMANALRATVVMDGEKAETELAKSFASQFAEFIEKTITPDAFPDKQVHQKMLNLLRDPEPLPRLREEFLAISEHYVKQVKQLNEHELKQVFIAACDPASGNLTALPKKHQDMAQSLRIILKTAVEHASGQGHA
jgi:hypothetical protein